MDAIRLLDQASLEELLRPHRALRAVLFGHIHQHWQGAWATRPDVLLLDLTPDGAVQHRVLRWSSI